MNIFMSFMVDPSTMKNMKIMKNKNWLVAFSWYPAWRCTSYGVQTTLFNGYSMMPSPPAFSSLGIRSRTTSEATTISTEYQLDW